MGQVISLIGVLDDGSAFAPLVPKNTAQPIQFPRLMDVTITVQVMTNAGIAVDVSNASTSQVYLTIQKDLQIDSDTQTGIGKFGVPKSGHTDMVDVSLTPADTYDIAAGNLYFSVSMRLGGKSYQLVKTSIATLEPACSVP